MSARRLRDAVTAMHHFAKRTQRGETWRAHTFPNTSSTRSGVIAIAAIGLAPSGRSASQGAPHRRRSHLTGSSSLG
jgi:hypothetical protein